MNIRVGYYSTSIKLDIIKLILLAIIFKKLKFLVASKKTKNIKLG